MPNPSARQNFFVTSANHPPQPPAVPQAAMAFLAQPVAVVANHLVLPNMECMLSEKSIYVFWYSNCQCLSNEADPDGYVICTWKTENECDIYHSMCLIISHPQLDIHTYAFLQLHPTADGFGDAEIQCNSPMHSTTAESKHGFGQDLLSCNPTLQSACKSAGGQPGQECRVAPRCQGTK